MHFLLQRISLVRIQLNPWVKSEHRQLPRKSKTEKREKITHETAIGR